MTLLHRPETEADEPQANAKRPPIDLPASAPSRRHRHRRWPWVLGAIAGLVLLFGIVFFVVDWYPSSPVSMGQAVQHLGSKGQGVAGARPTRGVYLYTGSGTDKLSLPPLAQAQGPTMPGTVTLQANDCWTFRVDYSSHHWQTWKFCRHGNDTEELGGQIWQFWAIGPLRETNLTNLTCTSGTMWLPATAAAGQTWQSHCTGTSSAVKGVMHSDGPYRFVGTPSLTVGGKSVPTTEFLQLRAETGAQRGTERDRMWLDASNGLPVRISQDISVVTATPFGTSTYTQSGTFTLQSLVPHT
jgi:hypothetical protein